MKVMAINNIMMTVSENEWKSTEISRRTNTTNGCGFSTQQSIPTVLRDIFLSAYLL